MNRYRIRRCNGNPDAWCLVRLNVDGTESHSYGSIETAGSLGALFSRITAIVRPEEGDRLELVPFKPITNSGPPSPPAGR